MQDDIPNAGRTTALYYLEVIDNPSWGCVPGEACPPPTHRIAVARMVAGHLFFFRGDEPTAFDQWSSNVANLARAHGWEGDE